jgi:hypothetical protein
MGWLTKRAIVKEYWRIEKEFSAGSSARSGVRVRRTLPRVPEAKKKKPDKSGFRYF